MNVCQDNLLIACPQYMTFHRRHEDIIQSIKITLEEESEMSYGPTRPRALCSGLISQKRIQDT